jgi:glycosyltransferase involved in cell wall biosynthesis
MKLAFAHRKDVLREAAKAAGSIGVLGAAANIARIVRDLAEPGTFRYLAPVKNRAAPWVWPRIVIGNRLFPRSYWGWAELSVSRHYGREFAKRLEEGPAVDALVTAEVKHVAFLEHHVPKLLWTDSLYGGLLDFYDYCQPLGRHTRRQLVALDRAAVARCGQLVFSSDWAAAKACQLYNLPAEQVRVIPFVPNLQMPVTETDVCRFIAARPRDLCRLLWVGTEWARKGGEQALAVTQSLIAAGIPSQLTVIGLSQPPVSWPEWVRDLGVLNLRQDAGRLQFAAAFETAHFLILPTTADCTPHVVCEAGEFGVPSLVTNIGGLPSLVRSGHNGQLFAPQAPASEYRDFIQQLWRDRPRYETFALQSFAEYEQRLNWRVAARELKKCLNQLTNPYAKLMAA